MAADGEVVAMAISEHVENAGVHSGDASLILPAQDLNHETLCNIEAIVRAIAKALAISGERFVTCQSHDNGVYTLYIS